MYSEESKDFYTKAGNKLYYRIVRGAGDEPLVLIHGKTRSTPICFGLKQKRY